MTRFPVAVGLCALLIQAGGVVAATQAKPAAAAAEAALWGSIRVPGTGRALRQTLNLGDPQRAETLIVFDYARRYLPRVENDTGREILERYLRYVTAVEGAAAAFPDGCRLPESSTPRAQRDAIRDFVELLGLELDEERGKYHVRIRTSDEGRQRQAWLDANGQDTEAAVATLNAGKPLKVALGHVEIPLPLPDYWQSEVFRRNEHPLVTLGGSRSITFTYVGLASLDDETLRYFASRPTLVRDIAGDSAATFAAFGRSLRVRDGAVQPPGGADAAALWVVLTDRRPTEIDRFIRTVLSRDSGRLAWFYDVVAHLDKARQNFLVGTHQLPGQRVTFGEAVYSWFRGSNDGWNVSEQPFSRPAFDPASAAAFVDVFDGNVVAPLWMPSVLQRVASSGDWPDRPDRTTRALRDTPADAAWMLWFLFESADGPLERFQLLRLAQRLFRAVPKAAAPDVEIALRSLSDMPSLAWSLERMGVSDPALFARVAWSARGLTHFGDGDDALLAIGRWQAALGLLEQIQLRRRLAPATFEKVLVALAATVGRDVDAFRGAIPAWMAEHLLPAVTRADVPPAGIETAAIEGFIRPDAPGPALAWEGLPYVIDHAGPAIKQVQAIRTVRRSPRLGHLVTLNDARRRLERGIKTLDEVKSLAAALASVEEGVRALPTADGGPHELTGDYRDAVETLTRITRDRDIPRARRTLELHVRLLDAFADAQLRSLVYALAVAPSDEPPDMSADAWQRHSIQKESAADLRDVKAIMWQRPRVGVMSRGTGVVVRGSYLGLDVALAESRLRTIAKGATPARGTLDQAIRQAIVEAVVLWHTDGPSRLAGLEQAASGVRAGRAAIGRWKDAPPARETLRATLQRARVDEARQNLILWLAERDAARAAGALTITEIYRLGADDPAASAWGGASAPVDGCLCLRALGPWTPEDVRGWASGALGSILADVPLRIAEELATLQLPAGLTPAVLPAALRDWLNRVDQTSADDWSALAIFPALLSSERIEEYLLALIADGTLAPPKDPK